MVRLIYILFTFISTVNTEGVGEILPNSATFHVLHRVSTTECNNRAELCVMAPISGGGATHSIIK